MHLTKLQLICGKRILFLNTWIETLNCNLWDIFQRKQSQNIWWQHDFVNTVNWEYVIILQNKQSNRGLRTRHNNLKPTQSLLKQTLQRAEVIHIQTKLSMSSHCCWLVRWHRHTHPIIQQPLEPFCARGHGLSLWPNQLIAGSLTEGGAEDSGLHTVWHLPINK